MMNYEGAIRARLAKPFNYGWRAHGNGFIKTYLDDAQSVRLNIWHSRLLRPVSHLHDHPWALSSIIVAGELTNTRWVRRMAEMGDPYMEGRINCAKFCGVEGEPVPVWLSDQAPEVYAPGSIYAQEPEEIHSTAFVDGTVTVMTRIAADTGGMASVFWPVGEEYGDASLDLTNEMIVETISAARRQIEHANAFALS